MGEKGALKGLATPKQLALLRDLEVAAPAGLSKQRAHELISAELALPRFRCKECGQKARVERLSEDTIEVSCCGIRERYTNDPRARVFPSIGKPLSTLTDRFGGATAIYGASGFRTAIDYPNFGVVEEGEEFQDDFE